MIGLRSGRSYLHQSPGGGIGLGAVGLTIWVKGSYKPRNLEAGAMGVGKAGPKTYSNLLLLREFRGR